MKTHPFTRPVDLHGGSSALWSEIRLEVYGIDARQHGWSTLAELERVSEWLQLEKGVRLLDVGCGEGGPARVLADVSAASVVGIDLDLDLLRMAAQRPDATNAGSPVPLAAADAARSLCFRSGVFDAISCVDVVPHLGPLDTVVSEWRRLLVDGSSRLLVIDPVVPGGTLSTAEIALRTGNVHYELRSRALFAEALERHHLELVEQVDLTEEMVDVAAAWVSAVQRNRRSLERLDGEAAVQHQLDFCRLILHTGSSGRLLRVAYVAQPASCGDHVSQAGSRGVSRCPS